MWFNLPQGLPESSLGEQRGRKEQGSTRLEPSVGFFAAGASQREHLCVSVRVYKWLCYLAMCLPVYFSVCVFVHMPVYASVCALVSVSVLCVSVLYVCIYVSVYMSVCLSLCISVYIFVHCVCLYNSV